MTRALHIFGLFCTLATTACSSPQTGTVVGNGAEVQMHLTAYDEVAMSSSLELDNGIVIDEMLVALRRIRLTPGTNCEEVEDDGEVDLEGPFAADLAGAGVLGGPPTFEATSGSFCRFRVDYHVAGDGEVPDELAGASILIRGRRADGASFEVRSRLGDRIELEAENEGFELPAGANPLHLAFGVGGPVAALSLDTLGAGPIVIDESNNPDQLDAFEEAMKDAASLFRDANRDGQLSSEERAAGSELAD